MRAITNDLFESLNFNFELLVAVLGERAAMDTYFCMRSNLPYFVLLW